MTRASNHRVAVSAYAAVALALVAVVGCSDDDAGGDTGGDAGGDAEVSTTVPSTDAAVDTTAADTTTSDDGDDGATDDGFAFTDPDGRYTVVFPFEPIRRTGATTLQDGTELEIVFHMAEGDTFARATSCLDYADYGSEGGIDLVAARDGAISNTGGNLLTSEDIVVQGRPAIEFTAAFNAGGETGFMIGRVFADDTASCQAFALDVADTLSDESFQFVESFQFTEAG